ncbi:hypothetical protein ABZ383_18255 [Streptomyces sp. NPDC005900]|uniref:hypothetical protein n=1 Tax=Streptomyces sp. NPDC005900 TaxID=3154569 RepID=UPI0033C89E9B
MRITLSEASGATIGQLRFRVCHRCRTGRVQNIWITEAHQREGRGREALHTLLAALPGYRWNTTMQSRAGRGFFRAMGGETGVPFPSGGPLCPHLEGRLRRWARRARARPAR